MTESFVFYKSFYEAIKLLPNVQEKWKAISSLMELGFYGVEPDLEDCSDMVNVIYILGEKQIKASVQHRLDGLKGGRPRKDGFNNLKNPPFEKSKSNANVNVNYNDNVNYNENANVEQMPTTLTNSQSKLSKTIFDLLKDAGLPCQKENEISFMMIDFKNAMSFLHSAPEYKHIHSDDIIKAVQNYIDVFYDPNSYITCRMDFFTLVKSKSFYSFLPANFSKMNFKKYNSKESEEEKPKGKIAYSDFSCSKCGKKKIYFNNELSKYKCDACNSMFEEFEEATGVHL